jgi:hypothetical protein
MGGAGDEEVPARRRPALLVLVGFAVVAVSIAAVLVAGRIVGDRLANDDPNEATVPVTGTQGTTTTTIEDVVLAPPVSIDRTPTSGG